MMNFSKTTTWLIIVLIIVFCTAGFFAYQWWQIKGELGKKIEENESLLKQIGELQREIEGLKVSKEEIEEGIKEETTGWKTYRNEKYGFEIDYPVVGWEFDGESLCRLKTKTQGGKEDFCIFQDVKFLYSHCFDYSYEKIISDAPNCFMNGIYYMEFEEIITTKLGVKGYKARGKEKICGWPEPDEGTEGVFFPIPMEVKLQSGPKFQPVLFIYYCLLMDYTQEDMKIFDQVISSFRFIER